MTPDPVTGFVVDLKWLKDVIEREVLAAYDHRHLNLEVPEFQISHSDDRKYCHCGVEAAGAIPGRTEKYAFEPSAGLRDAGDLRGVSGGSMKAYFGRRYSLSASHRLHTDALSEEENRIAYGKCNNPHGHGHNYVVEVLARGPVDPETGMVVDLVAFDEAVRTRILDRFDHTNLNLDPVFENRVPTTENLCKVVFGLLKASLPAAELDYVRVEETENNFFQCWDVNEEDIDLR